jgi:thiol-disulfide isomerase/thioredoxin
LLAAGKSVLLLFVSPTCSPCKTLLPLLRVWERDYSAQLTIALLSKGTLEENQKRIAKYGASHLLLQGEADVGEAYQAKWTPAAVLISPAGKIASQVSYGDESIRALVAHTVTTLEVSASNGNGHRPRITVGNSLFKVGEPAPRFSLPDLNGAAVYVEDLLGRDTLLLFWDPGCPYCQAMTEDLKRWEERSRPGVPRLVIVASGDVAAIKTKGQEFSSLVLSDPEFDLGPLFGTNSTPSAVLIDGEGRIASSLAKGEKNILALAGVRKVSLPIAARN